MTECARDGRDGAWIPALRGNERIVVWRDWNRGAIELEVHAGASHHARETAGLAHDFGF